MVMETITGKNSISRQSAALKALIEFYAGFNNRDVDRCMQNWASCDDIVMFNPIGGIRIGRDAVLQGYKKIMEGETRVYVEFYDYRLYETEALFYVAGRERGYAHRNDGQRIDLLIRTSRVFRKVGDDWRQVHHHGSIDDPTLLNQYQTLLKRR